MTKLDTTSTSTMIFTLEDDPVETPEVTQAAPAEEFEDLPELDEAEIISETIEPTETEVAAAEEEAENPNETEWERSLKALRTRHLEEQAEQEKEPEPLPKIEINPLPKREVVQRSTDYANLSDIVESTFGDQELDAAYREYLRQAEAEHNASETIVEDDIDVLIQEDWLNAQSALQSEHARKQLTASKTVILNGSQPENLPETELGDNADLVGDSLNSNRMPLPQIAVHVYDLPDLPSTRRIRVVSEKELMQGICDKLKPHLSNAVAGLVRQALQRKMATLSYDLQAMLNEATPDMVQDVLDHNLDVIFRTVKNQLREKNKS
ncbi:hypothetical protein QDY71_08105 [Kingella negevensis]|uniref:Uncharacterized protein n=1 Tax=Kingella negevensis TaxID=1522312 RepID=A0A238TA57_9NEIS|nr:hypothetical protein [Kingella negevensis]MDK4683676.1 hypothetical protein [Kingella negevensis]MDK4697709.1 hypothetical protein [Kingella negevensis]MDK4708429.1 hypothetical protein [Kingella negevensis]MDK4710910.1 hypothetical protein [Kingella negevensis]SNB67528.1 Uncharacterised protein [Kingella negevensis]